MKNLPTRLNVKTNFMQRFIACERRPMPNVFFPPEATRRWMRTFVSENSFSLLNKKFRILFGLHGIRIQ